MEKARKNNEMQQKNSKSHINIPRNLCSRLTHSLIFIFKMMPFTARKNNLYENLHYMKSHSVMLFLLVEKIWDNPI